MKASSCLLFPSSFPSKEKRKDQKNNNSRLSNHLASSELHAFCFFTLLKHIVKRSVSALLFFDVVLMQPAHVASLNLAVLYILLSSLTADGRRPLNATLQLNKVAVRYHTLDFFEYISGVNKQRAELSWNVWIKVSRKCLWEGK